MCYSEEENPRTGVGEFDRIYVAIQNPIRKIAFSRLFFAHVVTSPYKIAVLYECKHSQKAILHGSE